MCACDQSSSTIYQNVYLIQIKSETKKKTLIVGQNTFEGAKKGLNN
jgi:hypothetical protein